MNVMLKPVSLSTALICAITTFILCCYRSVFWTIIPRTSVLYWYPIA